MKTRRVTFEELKQLDEVACVWCNCGCWWVGKFLVHKVHRVNVWSITMWSSEDNTIASASDFIKADSCEEAFLRAIIAYSSMKIMMLHTLTDGNWAPPEMQEWSDNVSDNKAYEVTL